MPPLTLFPPLSTSTSPSAFLRRCIVTPRVLFCDVRAWRPRETPCLPVFRQLLVRLGQTRGPGSGGSLDHDVTTTLGTHGARLTHYFCFGALFVGAGCSSQEVSSAAAERDPVGLANAWNGMLDVSFHFVLSLSMRRSSVWCLGRLSGGPQTRSVRRHHSDVRTEGGERVVKEPTVWVYPRRRSRSMPRQSERGSRRRVRRTWRLHRPQELLRNGSHTSGSNGVFPSWMKPGFSVAPTRLLRRL